MREIRLSGSEGGGAEFNRLSLPLSSGDIARRQLDDNLADSQPDLPGISRKISRASSTPIQDHQPP